MFEAPDRVTNLIADWVDAHVPPVRQPSPISEAGAS
jgi:hypothetical protein